MFYIALIQKFELFLNTGSKSLVTVQVIHLIRGGSITMSNEEEIKKFMELDTIYRKIDFSKLNEAENFQNLANLLEKLMKTIDSIKLKKWMNIESGDLAAIRKEVKQLKMSANLYGFDKTTEIPKSNIEKIEKCYQKLLELEDIVFLKKAIQDIEINSDRLDYLENLGYKHQYRALIDIINAMGHVINVYERGNWQENPYFFESIEYFEQKLEGDKLAQDSKLGNESGANKLGVEGEGQDKKEKLEIKPISDEDLQKINRLYNVVLLKYDQIYNSIQELELKERKELREKRGVNKQVSFNPTLYFGPMPPLSDKSTPGAKSTPRDKRGPPKA